MLATQNNSISFLYYKMCISKDYNNSYVNYHNFYNCTYDNTWNKVQELLE